MAVEEFKPKQEEIFRPENTKAEIDETKLTTTEVQRMKKKGTSIKQLAAERMQLKAAAEAKLSKYMENENIINLKQYKEIKKELEEEKSPERTREILEKIHDLPRKKEKEKAKDKEESKELEPEDPKLLELQQAFNDICDKNKNLIGLKEIPGFKAWFSQERRKTPTIKHLKEITQRLEGKEITDKNGLAPRREEYQKLQTLFKKYGISDPQQSEWIKIEGLSERKDFRKNLEDFEDHFHKVKDTGFYSEEMIKMEMKKAVLSKTPTILKSKIIGAKNIARKEAEGFTHMDSKTSIQGITIRKMSKASKKKYLDYYKNTDFNEREKLVINWKKLVENEAKLAKDLSEIYKDNPEGFKLALGSFEELDYSEKENTLKEHTKLLEKTKNKEELEKTLTIKAAHAKIDAAAAKKIISKSSQAKYKEWFKDENNHRDPETREPGSLETLKNNYNILISSTPDGKARNLSAYEIKRERFKEEVKELQNINPHTQKEELKKWQDNYDEKSWTDRKKVYKDLKKEQDKQKNEQLKKRVLEEKAGLKESEKEKNKKLTPELEKTINSATELLNNNQAAEAMKILLKHNEADPDNPKILFWIKTAAEYMKEFGSGKKMEKTTEKELENELEQLAESNQGIKNSLEEEQIKTLNIKGTKQSENRHNKQKSAHERARKESMIRVEDGSLEADLTQDAYEQMEEEYILDKEGTGESLEEIEFNKVEMTSKKRQNLQEETYKNQSNLDTREGFNINLKDKSGRKLSAQEAGVHQEENLKILEKKMAETAEDRVGRKKTTETPGAKIFDLNAKTASRRKAKEIIEEKRHEKLRAT